MKKDKSLREHALGCVKAAPFIVTGCIIVAIACILSIRPPLWAIAIPIVTGTLVSLYLPSYWQRPALWKFGLFIGIFVSIQNAISHRLTPDTVPVLSLDFWIPIALILSLYSASLFMSLLMRRQFLLNLFKTEEAEQGAAANP